MVVGWYVTFWRRQESLVNLNMLLQRQNNNKIILTNIFEHLMYSRHHILIPGSGRSPGEGHSNPLQYSCLENPMVRGTWRATVHGVAKSWTWLKRFSTAQESYYLDAFSMHYLLQAAGNRRLFLWWWRNNWVNGEIQEYPK